MTASGFGTVSLLGQKSPEILDATSGPAQSYQHVAGKFDLSNTLQEDVYFRYNRHGWSGLLRTNVRSRWRHDIRTIESRGKGVILSFNASFNLTLQAKGEPELMLAKLIVRKGEHIF